MARIDSGSRRIRADTATVFQAFADPAAVASWLPPSGMTGSMLAFAFREGGGYRMRLSYDDPGHRPGKTSADADEVEVRIVELVPDRRIVQVVEFDSDQPEFAGSMRMTWSFEAVEEGTRVSVRAEDVPPGIRPEDHEAGLTSTLENLAIFVERSAAFEIRVLGPRDIDLAHALMAVFGEAFDEVELYGGARPGRAHLERLLGGDTFIALAALRDGEVVGGLVAYEMRKFERERSEIYLYDLAVAAAHRRRGIATALITELRRMAAARGANVVFVQAYPADEPAIALYETLAPREDVAHFEIPVDPANDR